jgi:hypothetical protein
VLIAAGVFAGASHAFETVVPFFNGVWAVAIALVGVPVKSVLAGETAACHIGQVLNKLGFSQVFEGDEHFVEVVAAIKARPNVSIKVKRHPCVETLRNRLRALIEFKKVSPKDVDFVSGRHEYDFRFFLHLLRQRNRMAFVF